MDSEFTKKDLLKVKKYEMALEELTDGTHRYFSITKLTSLKTLCKNEAILKDYCIFLANIILKMPGRLPVKTSKKKIKDAISGSSYPNIDQSLKCILYELSIEIDPLF